MSVTNHTFQYSKSIFMISDLKIFVDDCSGFSESLHHSNRPIRFNQKLEDWTLNEMTKPVAGPLSSLSNEESFLEVDALKKPLR